MKRILHEIGSSRVSRKKIGSGSRGKSPSSAPPRPPGSASSPICHRSNCMPTPHSTRWPMPASNPPTSTASRPPARRPVTEAHYLGLIPKWVDGTAAGGCSFMIHVRHAAAAITSGLCETVLITVGENGRSGFGRTRNIVAPGRTSPAGSSSPMGRWGRRLCSPDPGIALHEDLWPDPLQLAMVSVVQREWAAKNPRATFRAPFTSRTHRRPHDRRWLRCEIAVREWQRYE